MAVTVYGVSPDMGETEWSIYHRIALKGNWHEVVDLAADYVVSVATGTRLVSIAAGDMAICGTLVRNSAPTTVTFAANATGNPRIDAVVLEVNWTGSVTTAGTIKVVQGLAAVAPARPALSRTAGTLFQTPLAYVTIPSAAGQLTAGNIEPCAPQRRQQYVYKSTVDSATATTDTAVQIARIVIPDPGWPYRVMLMGSCGFTHVAAGHGVITGEVDGTAVTQGSAGNLNDADAVLRPDFSGNKTTSSVARLTMQRVGMTVNLVSATNNAGFTAVVTPN